MSEADNVAGSDDLTPRPPWGSFRRRLEWVFQVGLPDDEVRATTTAGELYDIIIRELEIAYETDDESANRSLTAVAADRLQGALEILFDIPPRQVTPEAEMDDLIPSRRRERAWRELGEEMDLRLPEIVISDEVASRSGAFFRRAFQTFVASLLVGLCAALAPSTIPGRILAVLAACGFIGSLVLFAASTFGNRYSIPPSCRTVGQTVMLLVRTNPVLLGWGRLTSREMWQVFQETLADRFDLPVEEVTRELETAPALFESEFPEELSGAPYWVMSEYLRRTERP